MVCLLAAFAVLSPWRASAQGAAPTPSSAAAVGADTLAQCERAVRQVLVPSTRATADVRLSTAPAVVPSLSNNRQVVLHGEGQWGDAAAMRKFTYNCNIDSHSGEAVGVVIRQAAAPPAAAEPQPIDPDLGHLSPAACESIAAEALKKRWPQVSKISFDTETRRLTQQSASHAELRGQGRAQTAPESQSLVHFGFDCEIDPRDGKVIGMRLRG